MTKTKQTILWSALIVLALVLSGCASTVQQNAVRALQTEEAARAVSPAGSSADISYSRGRLPVLDENAGLREYLTYAALNNPGLEAAFNRWKAALERIAQARTLPDPRFNYGYFIQEVETRVGPQQQRVGIGQMFPWFGKLRLRGDAAAEAANAAQQHYESAKLRLFEEVKQSYYELYYLGRSIAITEENVELLKYLEEVARSKYEAGTALHADVIKAQVELDRLRDRLRTLAEIKKPTLARLNAALNRPADAPLTWPTNLTSVRFDANAPALIEQLKAANPELRMLDFQVEREKDEIALAKKEFYPDVTLGLDYVVTDEARMAGVSDSGKDPVMLGFSINLPLWWEKYRAGVREAEQRHTATQQEREDRANRLSTDLKLAVFKFEDAERKIALYRDALIPKADQNLKVIQRAYEAGKSDFLSLIDAERILLEFQLTFERATSDREQGLATLERLVGGNARGTSTETEKKP